MAGRIEQPLSTPALEDLAEEGALQLLDRLASPVRDAARLIPVDSITPNPATPRRHFNEAALESLALSIRHWGQLQPVIVRCATDHYELVCGERRWLAHKRAGLATIWAVERRATDAQSLALALVENLQRVGLSHVEKVAALDQLAELSDADGLRNVARQLCMTPGWLSSQLAVRRDPVIFPALDAGRIGFGQAAELMRGPAPARTELLQRVVNEPGHVATATIRKWVADARAAAATSPRPAPDSNYEAVAEQVSQLQPPRTAAELAAVRRISACAQQLLAKSACHEQELHACGGSVIRKSVSTEVKCLMCGEHAGEIEEQLTFKARNRGSIRHVGNRLQCGRCGGALAREARTERFRY